MIQKKREYSCSEILLYTIATASWNACSSFLAKFAGYKAFYTPNFITASLQAITDAQNLPDSRQVITDRSTARVNLIAATYPVKTLWQQLKHYITGAYPAELLPSKLEAAGASLYKHVSANNWASVSSLIFAANNFMTANLAALTENDNMPAGFPTTFSDAGDDWSKLATKFFNADNAKKMAVDEKLDANNAIYESVISMMKDGQQVFISKDSAHILFVFEQQVKVYKGFGSSSLKGYITNESKMPVVGAIIATNELDYKTATSSKGRFSINRMLAGNYLVTVTYRGYNPVEYLVKLTAGTSTKLDVTLTSVMKKVA